MNVLVACEESQEICKAFRRLGHKAFSCDLQECSGGHPEWHIQGDVLRILNPWYGEHFETDLRTFQHTHTYKGISFETCDGHSHCFEGCWDLIIAHPPCTYLTVTGNRWFNVEQYGDKALKRIEDRKEAIKFFMSFVDADCNKVAIENPVGIMSSCYRKPDQIIHPWQFAIEEWEKTKKQTCLWLKGLPLLTPTWGGEPDIAYHEWISSEGNKKRQSLWYYNTRCLPHKERAKAASKTFPGIARAMAAQWG